MPQQGLLGTENARDVGNAGNATKKSKKPGFVDISQSRPSKADTSNPLQIPKKIDFQKHDNADVSQFLQIQAVPQRITALGPTQTPNRPIPTSLKT